MHTEGRHLAHSQIIVPSWRALTGRLSVIAKGESAVSRSCQIPDVRRKYLDIGLPSRSGVFVEIGGFDGERFSNTSFLADQGWRGLYVEPVPAFCKRIKRRHRLNHVAVECAAISETEGTGVLHLMGALSTANAASLAAYDSIPWARSSSRAARQIEVRTDTLQAVLARHAVPDDLDLMIVDVEGGEEPIVVALLESRWRPSVLIVELIDIHPDFSHAPELQTSHRRVRQRIVDAGYREYYADAVNSIFCRL